MSGTNEFFDLKSEKLKSQCPSQNSLSCQCQLMIYVCVCADVVQETVNVEPSSFFAIEKFVENV